MNAIATQPDTVKTDAPIEVPPLTVVTDPSIAQARIDLADEMVIDCLYRGVEKLRQDLIVDPERRITGPNLAMVTLLRKLTRERADLLRERESEKKGSGTFSGDPDHAAIDMTGLNRAERRELEKVKRQTESRSAAQPMSSGKQRKSRRRS